MGKKRTKKELQTIEVFGGALGEEVSVCAKFDLPLSVLALHVEGEWEKGDIRRLLDALRVADLVAQPYPQEILIALPNTSSAEARVVEQRLRDAVPEATLRVAAYTRGDTAEGLIELARHASPREPS